MMKTRLVCALFLLTLAPSVFAETIVVPAGDVVALTNALASYQLPSDKIQLSPGDYDLSGVAMEATSSNGGSHLVLTEATLEGLGETADDTRLVGDGTLRVLWTVNTKFTGRVRNLTITNGYAKAVSGVSKSGCGGGLYGYHYVTNCVIIGNKADTCGGGACNYTYLDVCRIENNVCVSGDGGGAWKPNRVNNCLVRGNSAKRGGGVYSDECRGEIIGSRIVENVASSAAGGVSTIAVVSNSVIALNVAGDSGGGLHSWNTRPTAFNCTICSNRSSSTAAVYGGGVFKYNVVGGAIFANSGVYGGGAANASLTGVEIHDNFASGTSGANGLGGGLYSGAATNCVFRSNAANEGNNAWQSALVGCDVSTADVYGGSLLACTIHDVGGEYTLANPYASVTKTPNAVLRNFVAATNCLFRSNVLPAYGTSLVLGNSSQSYSSRFVNCTVVSNQCGRTFAYFKQTSAPLYVENSVFFGNRDYDGTATDLMNRDKDTLVSGAVLFSDSAFGLSSGLFGEANLPNYTLRNLWQFGAGGFGADPKFMGGRDARHPFALRRASPLRRKGGYAAWMASATDIRGEGFARASGGQVDIGCYQCLIPAPGGLMLLW